MTIRQRDKRRMKVEERYIECLDRKVTFYIGKNAKDNFKVIDMGEPDDLWFHVKNETSCHVVALISHIPYLEKEEMKMIVKEGSLLCKENTFKVASLKNVAIDYTFLKNIKKTKIVGTVLTQNLKTIVC